jgi:hypothetical protein
MDDATRLISDLQQKLADLDHKVAAYREDMAAEFKRYSIDLLQNVPEEVSAEVERVIAESMSHYPAIRPSIEQAESPRLPSDRQSWHGRTSPPPFAVRADSRGREAPGSPREREKELQGLFTPSYLPLLDSSGPSLPVSQTSPPRNLAERAADIKKDKGEGPHSSPSPPPSPPPAGAELPQTMRPKNVRRSTDDTTSSVISDRSDSRQRRSALRRSSSSSKPQSPRRVRFEFAGGEVLPTASPQGSAVALDAQPQSESSMVLDDSISVEAILGPDEINDPPPKKVSSSQALRALSKSPLDAGTIWTVVNADSEDGAIVDATRNSQTSNSGSSLDPVDTLRQAPIQPEPAKDITVEGVWQENLLDKATEDSKESAEYSSEEEFLSIAKRKSFANKKPIMSPLSRSPAKAIISPKLPDGDEDELTVSESELQQQNSKQEKGLKQFSPLPSSAEDEDEEEDDLFQFETGLSAPPKPKLKPLPEDDDEELDDIIETKFPKKLSLPSSPPAIPVLKPAPPLTPLSAKFASGSLGSYKGRPITMPVVLNPELHVQAESLGEFNTFVGGLDGRSGMDEGDMSSFRASFAHAAQAHFSGTPRSLTERMLMEDAIAQRRAEMKEGK